LLRRPAPDHRIFNEGVGRTPRNDADYIENSVIARNEMTKQSFTQLQ
jgi:hypothetical protein